MYSPRDSSSPDSLDIDEDIGFGNGPPPLPPPAPPPPRAFGVSLKNKEHEIDISELNGEKPRPEGHGWFQIWSPAVLQEVIVRHNAGCGSADVQDRSRDAAALRQILRVGPWRQCRMPSHPAVTIRRSPSGAYATRAPTWAPWSTCSRNDSCWLSAVVNPS